jgi:threonine/homoserine/homoserine lactone efflux protein
MPDASRNMKLHTLFFAALLTGLSGAMMPGPVLALVVSETSRRGFVASPLIITGHAILELVLVAALFLGLRRFLSTTAAFVVLGLAGGGVLVWMGQGMIAHGLDPATELPLQATAVAAGRLLLAGAIISLANPYWSLWWGTVGTKLLQMSVGHGVVGAAFYFLGHISSDYLWYSVVGWLVSFNRSIWAGAPYRYLLVACGSLILLMGVYFVYSAARRWLSHRLERIRASTESPG